MPLLYDDELSAECYTARLMLALLGVSYDVRPFDLSPGGEVDWPGFRAISPDGRVPVLEDDGKVVAGVADVLMHVASTYDPGGTWFPAAGRGLVAAWVAFATGELAVLEQARQAQRLGRGGVEPLREQGRRALRVLEDRVADRASDGSDWLVRETISIADIAAFPHVALSHESGIGVEEFPALAMWQGRIRRLPGFVAMSGMG